MVHMSNDGHVLNVFLFVHTFSDLVYREIDLKQKFKGLNVNLKINLLIGQRIQMGWSSHAEANKGNSHQSIIQSGEALPSTSFWRSSDPACFLEPTRSGSCSPCSHEGGGGFS